MVCRLISPQNIIIILGVWYVFMGLVKVQKEMLLCHGCIIFKSLLMITGLFWGILIS
jgi:hypothetical protein